MVTGHVGSMAFLWSKNNLHWIVSPFTILSWVVGLHYWLFETNTEFGEALVGILAGILLVLPVLAFYARIRFDSANYDGKRLPIAVCILLWLLGGFLTLLSAPNSKKLVEDVFHTLNVQLEWEMLNAYQFIFLLAFMGNIVIGLSLERYIRKREEKIVAFGNLEKSQRRYETHLDQETTEVDISKFHLVFLIPAYNEEGSIGPLLRQITSFYPRAEIVVVNNNSSDQTVLIAKANGALVIDEGRQGKANAILSGLKFIRRKKRNEIIVMLDADMTYLPADARQLLNKLIQDNLDIVVGSRLRGQRTPESMSSLNLFGNIGFSVIARFLYGGKISDICSGYWAFRGKAIDRLLNLRIESDGFALEAELFAKAAISNLKVGETPIRYFQRTSGNSTLRSFHDGLKIMSSLFKCKFPIIEQRFKGSSAKKLSTPMYKIRPLKDRLLKEGHSTLTVSFVFPALNEETSIEETLMRIPLSSLKKIGLESEVIVVDNGSNDRTAELAACCGAIVVSEPRKGYGNAYKAGFAAATGDIIVMSDADGTYPIQKSFQLIKPILDGYADAVIGSRFLGTIENGAMKRIHKIGNRILTFQLNLLFAFRSKRPISDAHSGFRAFKADSLHDMELHTSGMEFASELVIESFRKSLRISEIPICYSARTKNSQAKLRTLRDGARHFLFMLNVRIAGKKTSRFLRDTK